MRAAYGPGHITARTDHDVWHDPVAPDRLGGVEHTIDKDSYLHVVEVEALDGTSLSFLAHPSIPFPENTRERAAQFMDTHDIDAVEKFNRGSKEYGGTIPGAIELANDDAHNEFQTDLSYMTVDVDTPTGGSVLSAIRSGDFTCHCEPSSVRAAAGRLGQGMAMCLSAVR